MKTSRISNMTKYIIGALFFLFTSAVLQGAQAQRAVFAQDEARQTSLPAPKSWMMEASALPDAGVYWCRDSDGATWFRIQVEGHSIRSITAFDAKTMDEPLCETSKNNGHDQISNCQEVVDETSLPKACGTQPLHPADALSTDATAARAPRYYSSLVGMSYHSSETCPCGCRIKPQNRLYFNTAEAAEDAGKLPCRRCCPH